MRLLCLLCLAALGPAARANLIFQAMLLPTNEVPPHVSDASGFITVDLHNDLNTLDVAETFSNLAAPASAAHIHCCAPPGTNAPVRLPFTGFPNAASGSYNHTFDLATDLTGITPSAFIAAMESGQTYANIHDSPFPGGDIRGQLLAVPEPSTVPLVLPCIGIAVLAARRRNQGFARAPAE